MPHSRLWYNFLFENIFSCFRVYFSCFRTSFPVLECPFPVFGFEKVILSLDINGQRSKSQYFYSCPCPGTKQQLDVPSRPLETLLETHFQYENSILGSLQNLYTITLGTVVGGVEGAIWQGSSHLGGKRWSLGIMSTFCLLFEEEQCLLTSPCSDLSVEAFFFKSMFHLMALLKCCRVYYSTVCWDRFKQKIVLRLKNHHNMKEYPM